MGKKEYQLTVRFCTEKAAVYFEGESYLRSNLSDWISISSREICLTFARIKKPEASTLLFSPNSLFRYQLQKALCYYLAIACEIPKVERIWMATDREETDIDFQAFVQTWDNCRCRSYFKPEDLNVIFSSSEKAKFVYIALTYWLKNELSLFRNDGLRSLWSAFNALYGANTSSNDSETKKLNRFRSQVMRNEYYKNSISCMKELFGDTFWRNQGLYLYVSRTNAKYLEKCQYGDSVVLQTILRKLSSISKKTKEDETVRSAMEKIRQELGRCKENEYERLCFLVFEYVYYRRNRMFHGGQEYPVFEFYKNDTDNEDFLLCELLRCFIADSIRAFQRQKDDTKARKQ